MKINWKAILFTIGLYITAVLSVYITETLYVPRGANDITGPPFMVAVLGALVILFFLIRSIYQAIVIAKAYWIVVLLHLILIGIFVSRFMI